MGAPLSEDDARIVEEIASALKTRGQLVMHFEEDQSDEVARLRSLGRRAGRDLGWKVTTFASDPDHREDRKIVVIVVVRESNPLHEELMRVRGEKAVRQLFKDGGL